MPEIIPNPFAGREHIFLAWRLSSGSDDPVVMREAAEIVSTQEEHDSDD